MMKMLIQLDEKKVEEDGVYELADMWRIIDGKFEKACTKEIQSDGSRMYSGDPNKDYYSEIMVAAMVLKQTKWFAEHCTKWIWYENDEDDAGAQDKPMQFYETDVLANCRENNNIFKRG